jgi:hypothetical protein
VTCGIIATTDNIAHFAAACCDKTLPISSKISG